jgi:hypothetical protein
LAYRIRTLEVVRGGDTKAAAGSIELSRNEALRVLASERSGEA